MKAVILSGGIGKRLKPLTDYIPKSLVPVDNIAIIDWQIKYLKKFGIKDLVICAGHLSANLISHLESKKIGMNVRYSVEKAPLGTGGAIKKARKYIDDNNFFVINGDIITNINLLKLKARPNTIAVIPLRTPYGVTHISGNKVDKFEEKPEIFNHWMNAGIYYLSKEIFDYLPAKGNLETITFPALAKKGQLYVEKFTNVFWNSIDSHKDIEECMMNIKKTHHEKFLSE